MIVSAGKPDLAKSSVLSLKSMMTTKNVAAIRKKKKVRKNFLSINLSMIFILPQWFKRSAKCNLKIKWNQAGDVKTAYFFGLTSL